MQRGVQPLARGDRAELDADARPLDLALEDRGRAGVELPGQEPVEEFDDPDLRPAAADGPGDLEPEQSAAEDDGPPVLAKKADEDIGVVERPHDEDALLVGPDDGGPERPRARRQEEDVVGDGSALRRLDRPLGAADPGGGRAEAQGDSLLLRPAFGKGEDPLPGQPAGQILDQVRPGVIGMPLLSEDLDPDAGLELAKRLGRDGAGQAAADDDGVHVRTGDPRPGSAKLDEKVLADAALGADPGVGQVVEARAGREAVIRVARGRIVDIAARGALVFVHSARSFQFS